MNDKEFETVISFQEYTSRVMRRYQPCIIYVKGNLVESFDEDGNSHHKFELTLPHFAIGKAKVLKKEYEKMRPDIHVTLVIHGGKADGEN